MSRTTRRIMLLSASAALVAGGVSLSPSAFAAPATPHLSKTPTIAARSDHRAESQPVDPGSIFGQGGSGGNGGGEIQVHPKPFRNYILHLRHHGPHGSQG